MARIARIVIPHLPHHVTQRGNRRQQTFFNQDDYQYYLDLLVEARHHADIEIWAYCLMPNHVHLVIVPEQEDGLARLFKEAHRHYTRHINFRNDWRGHLWQERFHSFVMDENYLLATVRYTELNPVRAGLCEKPEQWKWSSVHAHLSRKDDQLVSVSPMLERISNWSDYLSASITPDELDTIRRHTKTGRPVQSEPFLSRLHALTGTDYCKGKPGRKTE